MLANISYKRMILGILLGTSFVITTSISAQTSPETHDLAQLMATVTQPAETETAAQPAEEAISTPAMIAMDDYFYWKDRNPDKAQAILKNVLRRYPQNADAQAEMGFLLIDQNQPKEALPYFIRAHQLQPSNEEYSLQIAYLQAGLGNTTEARAEFDALAKNARSKTVREAAQKESKAMQEGTVEKWLPYPWFGDLYFAPYYSFRFNNLISPLSIRFGLYLDKNRHVQAYARLRHTRDIRSSSGQTPDILEDNAAIISLGLRYTPVLSWPLFTYIEYGKGYDLIDRGRSRWLKDFRSGIVGYYSWGPADQYAEKARYPFKFNGDAYGDFSYYTRYDDNFIGDFFIRPGFRVFEYHHSNVDLYAKARYLFDSRKYYYNNTTEYGLGTAWRPYYPFPMTVSLEHIWGHYHPVNGPDENPYGRHYQDTILQLEFYWDF